MKLAPLEEAATLPADWYFDPAIARLEEERIFHRSWQYAGRAEQVARPGDFFTCRMGRIPVVVVRERGDTLRAHVNVWPTDAGKARYGELMTAGEERGTPDASSSIYAAVVDELEEAIDELLEREQSRRW